MNYYHEVDSRMIRKIGYNDKLETLTIEFVMGRTYNYYNVPLDTFTELRDATSKGEYFITSIKDVYEYDRVL